MSKSPNVQKKFQSQLHEFTETNSSFKVVYSTLSTHITPGTTRLCILDSSFNPPHKGHLSLITKSINHSKGQTCSVLLLLSVQNADKLTPTPASFEDRLDMMCLLADYIQSNYKVAVSVALTNHAKFVDKSSVIQDWAKEIENKELKYLFLVGFDTLIRIFDPKYYKPFGIDETLTDFMQLNEFFCLTRTDEKNDDVDAQHQYVHDIASGETELPREWATKIHLVEGDDNYLHISSSTIRKQTNEANWEAQVVPTIAEYIKHEELY